MSADADPLLDLSFEADVIVWRGPSPYFFAPVPATDADEIQRVARAASYGWGVIPVQATIGETTFTTSLFPRDGTYLLPLKDAVRRKVEITAGDRIAVAMTVRFGRR